MNVWSRYICGLVLPPLFKVPLNDTTVDKVQMLSDFKCDVLSLECCRIVLKWMLAWKISASCNVSEILCAICSHCIRHVTLLVLTKTIFNAQHLSWHSVELYLFTVRLLRFCLFSTPLLGTSRWSAVSVEDLVTSDRFSYPWMVGRTQSVGLWNHWFWQLMGL